MSVTVIRVLQEVSASAPTFGRGRTAWQRRDPTTSFRG